MRKFKDIHFDLVTYEILAGEYYATSNRDVILTTLVGSCVAVCLIDKYAGVAGINHFMLSDKHIRPKRKNPCDTRYGMCSMEMLVSAMAEKGAMVNRIEAKVFGGGKVIEGKMVNVASQNIEFILEHLEQLDIPITASDLGGNHGRKIHFFTKDGQVKLKPIKHLDRH